MTDRHRCVISHLQNLKTAYVEMRRSEMTIKKEYYEKNHVREPFKEKCPDAGSKPRGL